MEPRDEVKIDCSSVLSLNMSDITIRTESCESANTNTYVSSSSSVKKETEARGNDIPYTLLRRSERVADWDEYLKDPKAFEWICPVDFFEHAPFASNWKNFAKTGVKVEVTHPQSLGKLPVYSVATIVAFAGYKALIKFEKVGRGPEVYAWMSYCSPVPKYLGYAISKNYLLLPAFGTDGVTNDDDEMDFKELNEALLKRIFFGSDSDILAQTIPKNHEQAVLNELNEHQGSFKMMDILEVMDKEEPVRNRLAYVTGIVGDRIHVHYLDAEPEDEGYCFNVKSELVHPLGWSHCVGQSLKTYASARFTFPRLSKRHFPKCPSHFKINTDMAFELRHPFHPYKIVAGYVLKVLRHGYFVAKVDTNLPGDSAEFVFHITSDYILYCGFCKNHNIRLEVPGGEDQLEFSWDTYCLVKHVTPLDLTNVCERSPHKFVKGCKLESVDICQPIYFGPATVLNVADHLLLLHFDGWSRSREDCRQWISVVSPDIYPTGWAEMVGHIMQSHAKPPIEEDSYFILPPTVNEKTLAVELTVENGNGEQSKA